MDLLRSRATSKAKTVICLNNTTNGVLCVLNLSRNRLLIIFARLPALFQKLKGGIYMAYENKIKFYEEQIEALLYNIEEKEKSYIYEQVRIIKQKIEELKK